MMVRKILWLCLGVIFIACKNQSAEKESAVTAENVYGTYLFTVDDAAENVSCLFQFSRRKNSKGHYLPKNVSVSLDGQPLTADSISIGEVYYEMALPFVHFGGDHVIALKKENGTVLKEELNVKPVRLTSQIPEKLKRADLVFLLEGIEEFDKVQLGLIDTSFTTNDFHLDTVLQSGRLPVHKSQLTAVSNGPLTIYLMVEKRRLLQSDLKGEVLFRYIFRRETELVD